MINNKPIASLSLDLDNLWPYMKTHGDAGWESFPSYLDVVVPRILKFLEERSLIITFFIVGQDAALEKNRKAIQSIANAGHEIGNHSFSHEPWLHLYTEEQVESELTMAERYIGDVTGCKPVGFRGPGYSLSPVTIKALINKGYCYDASTLPTFIGPLARIYYFMTARLSQKEKEERRLLFGSLRDGLRPIKPYQWLEKTGRLIEIPVTTMPLFRIPVHLSYILYISTFSPALALLYFKFTLLLFRLNGVHPSLLLHPLDFIDCGDFKELAFFPAMNLPKEKKLSLISKVLHLYTHQFQVVSLQQHALDAEKEAVSVPVERYFRTAGRALS